MGCEVSGVSDGILLRAFNAKPAGIQKLCEANEGFYRGGIPNFLVQQDVVAADFQGGFEGSRPEAGETQCGNSAEPQSWWKDRGQ